MRWTNAYLASALTLASFACADDGKSEVGTDAAETSGDGDGDGEPGDGDGDGEPGDGDGDGEPGDGDGEPGDGDGEPGDGDGEPGDGDGESGDGDGEPGDGDGDGEGDPIMCPGVFPIFDKSCSGVDECAIGVHTTDCCGNSVALGMNSAELEAFNAAEAICDSQYPACGCPAMPTMAEDGQPVADPRSLAVDCIEGSCMTFVQ